MTPLVSAPFVVTDILRRAQADTLGWLGLAPMECSYRELDSGTYWRLRDYAGRDGAPARLVVAGPIKRPYIWDISASASALRRLRERAHVYMVEWLPARRQGSEGIDDYVRAISQCVATITAQSRGASPFVVGHSLGGTLAAVFASLAPDRVRGLVLLSAPLCFAPATSHFRDALTAMIPSGLSEAGPLPGSLLSLASALASPETFVWSRFWDAALSSVDPAALDLQARVERWALDEVAVPGRLVCEIIEGLYRENRLCRGTLNVGNVMVGPSRLSVPTLAVVTRTDEVAPLASVKPFTNAMPTADVRLIEHPGEVGVGLQHLGVLIGRQAHARVWPEIVSWLDSRR